MDQQVMVNGMSVTSLTGTGGTRTNWSRRRDPGVRPAARGALGGGRLWRRSSPTSCRRKAPTGSAAQLFANFANEDLQADNLDDELQARGLTVVNKTKKLVDVSPSFGGPIRADKTLVLRGVPRRRHRQLRRRPLLQPDADGVRPTRRISTRPAVNDQRTYSATLNLTWQMSQQQSPVGLRHLREDVSLSLLDQPDGGARSRHLQSGRQQHRAGAARRRR